MRWAQAAVSFEVDPALEAEVPGATAAVATAVASWSALPGLPALSAVPASAPAQVANDGRNVIYFAADGDPRAGRALAITIISFDEQTGEMVDCDIVFNGKRDFALLPSGATASADAPRISTEGGGAYLSGGAPFDLQHVVAHEIGHALGLGDEPADTAAVMYPITAPGDASRRAPASDDASGIQSLYAGQGPQPMSTSPAKGCGARIAPAASGPGADAPLGTAFVASLFAAIALYRRRARRIMVEVVRGGRP